jgi:two-component system nitrate/nitrite response regulator NarL
VDAVRAVVADGDPLARNVLRAACRAGGVRVVGEATTTGEAVALCQVEAPDVAVVAASLVPPDAGDGDAGGPDGPSALETCIDAILAVPTRVLLLTDDHSPERLTGMLERGVSGYLLLDTPPAQVADAVAAVAAGAAALSPPAARTVLDQWRRLRRRDRAESAANGKQLTAREREILAAMADGLAAKAIARRLGIAVKTVENHKIRIFDKLGVRSQAQAVSLAIGWGLLAGPATAPAGDGQG